MFTPRSMAWHKEPINHLRGAPARPERQGFSPTKSMGGALRAAREMASKKSESRVLVDDAGFEPATFATCPVRFWWAV